MWLGSGHIYSGSSLNLALTFLDLKMSLFTKCLLFYIYHENITKISTGLSLKSSVSWKAGTSFHVPKIKEPFLTTNLFGHYYYILIFKKKKKKLESWDKSTWSRLKYYVIKPGSKLTKYNMGGITKSDCISWQAPNT